MCLVLNKDYEDGQYFVYSGKNLEISSNMFAREEKKNVNISFKFLHQNFFQIITAEI